MGAQASIPLKKDSPVPYIVGAQTPILLKRDFPGLYIVGAQAPKLLKKVFCSFSFSVAICDTVFMHGHCFSIRA